MASSSGGFDDVLKDFLHLCFTDKDWEWLSTLLGQNLSFESTIDEQILKDHLEAVINTFLPNSRRYKLCNVLLWIVRKNFDANFVLLIRDWKLSDENNRGWKAQEIKKIFNIPKTEIDDKHGFAILELTHRHVETERSKITAASLASLSFVPTTPAKVPLDANQTEHHNENNGFSTPPEVMMEDSNKSDYDYSFSSEAYEVVKDVHSPSFPQEVEMPEAESFVILPQEGDKTTQEGVKPTQKDVKPAQIGYKLTQDGFKLPQGGVKPTQVGDPLPQDGHKPLSDDNKSAHDNDRGKPPQNSSPDSIIRLESNADTSTQFSDGSTLSDIYAGKHEIDERKKAEREASNTYGQVTRHTSEVSLQSQRTDEPHLGQDDDKNNTTKAQTIRTGIVVSYPPRTDLTYDDADYYYLKLIVKLGENFDCTRGQMLVYWHESDEHYPLVKDEQFNTYTLVIPCKVSSSSFEYKYLFLDDTKKHRWEYLTTDVQSNRLLSLSDNQIKDGHVFQFDVAFIGKDNYYHITSEKRKSKTADKFVSFLEELKQGGPSDQNYPTIAQVVDWSMIGINGWKFTRPYNWNLVVDWGMLQDPLSTWIERYHFYNKLSFKIAFVLRLFASIRHADLKLSGRMLNTLCDCLDFKHQFSDQKLLFRKLIDIPLNRLRNNNMKATIKLLFELLRNAPWCYLKVFPLYWLVKSDGEDVFNASWSTLFEAANIPYFKHSDWNPIRAQCYEKADAQQKILDHICTKNIFTGLNSDSMKALVLYFLNINSVISILCKHHDVASNFPVDMVLYKLTTQWNEIYNFDFLQAILPNLLESINNERAAVLSIDVSSDAEQLQITKKALRLQKLLETTLDLLKKTKQSPFSTLLDTCIWCLNIVSHSFGYYNALQKQFVAAQKEYKLKGLVVAPKSFIEKCLSLAVGKIIVAKHLVSDAVEMVKCLNELANLNVMKSEERFWMNILLPKMTKIVEKFWTSKDDFLNSYLDRLINIKIEDAVKNLLEDKLYEIMEEYLTNPGKLQRLSSNVWTPKIIKVTDKLFLKEWNKAATVHNYNNRGRISTEMTIALITQSQFLSKYMEMLSFHQTKPTDKVIHHYDALVDGCFCLYDDFKNGNIKIFHLKRILSPEQKDKFHEVFYCLEEKQSTKNLLPILLDKREQEVLMCAEFLEKISVVQEFVARSGLDVTMQFPLNAYNLESCKIQDFINPIVNPSCIRRLRWISDQQMQEIYILKKSRVFSKIWVNTAKELKSTTSTDEKVQLEYVMQNIWMPSKQQLGGLIESIIKGDIRVSDVINTFEDCNVDEEMEYFEMFYPALDIENKVQFHGKDKKLKQIKVVLKTNQLLSKANILNRVIQTLNIQSIERNFDDVKFMTSINDENGSKLEDVPAELASKQHKLEQLDKRIVKILLKFVEHSDLVEFFCQIREFQQVQVMCDMAMASVGGDGLNIGKISALLNIATGFGPLLFDLESIATFEDLIEKCEEVFKNYNRERTLLEEWSDCATEIKWFKEIKDLKGSAESETIKLAKKMNEKGRYTIRNDGCDDWQRSLSLSIMSEPKENISLKKLVDLRDKLMLVANVDGERQKDVKYFIDLFSYVERLTKSYLSILNEGCLLFHKWTAEIWYDEKKEDDDLQQNICIHISFGDKMKRIKTKGTIELLPSLDEIFREAFNNWKNFIDNLRTEYYLINYLSIKQITYLCKELATWKTKLPDQVIVLLSSIFPNVTTESLRNTLSVITTMKNIRGTIVFEENPLNRYNCGTNQVKLAEEVSEIEEKMKAVSKLMREQTVSAKVAKAAIQSKGFKDIENCIFWVLEHQNNAGLVNRLSQEFDNETQFDSKKLANVQINTNIFEGNSELTLKSVIEKLQASSEKNSINFLSSIKTIIFGFCSQATAISLQDFLSFDSFGKLLNKLHQSIKQTPIKRSVPIAGFEHGHPNLIKCSEETMFSTVLSLYSFCPDQPLPTSAEVLVCSSHTSCNEVEAFMRRAMCTIEEEENVYCMAFAERLSFNATVHVEEMYQNLSRLTQCNKNYQLIILTSSSQHYIAGCFEKYTFEGRVLQQKEKLQTYLARHLKAKASNGFLEANEFNVKLVSSIHNGVGKSLFIERVKDKGKRKLMQKGTLHHCTTLRLVEREADTDQVIKTLFEQNNISNHKTPNMIHVDITPAVRENIFEMLFNLVILGSIVDRHGKVWRKDDMHVYMLEITLEHSLDIEQCNELLQVLPNMNCGMPRESLLPNHVNAMDQMVFKSENVQRPFQYLVKYANNEDLDKFKYNQPRGTPQQCLETYLRFYPLKNPTWSQIIHFANFLNIQLSDCEASTFCKAEIVGDALSGLKQLVVTSIINMAQDFCTPSLELSDESYSQASRAKNDDFERHQLRRRWEQDSHPYIFFNHGGLGSMSFLNFDVDQKTGIILDKNRKEIGRMPNGTLALKLKKNDVNLSMDLDKLGRQRMLSILCDVMGVEPHFDPDQTFELTSDNVLKMLAIHMRFRSKIPVVILGETGCGKTRMMEFMSKLLAGDKSAEKRMFTLKIHGGITSQDIYQEAFRVSEHCRNLANKEKPVILFFDEANTTQAIYAIKELVCDNTCNGLAINSPNLHFVAACNPYKKLSDAAIKNLKDSGLGYRIKEEETKYKLGNIAMRKLVYRVVALPPSIQPLAWDFGQLKTNAEKKYIDQMCKKLQSTLQLQQNEVNLIAELISESQQFMREQKDECHYVSMRDIERCMKIYQWFHKVVNEEFTAKMEKEVINIPKYMRCLLQSLNICYYVSLQNREAYVNRLDKICSKHVILFPAQIQTEFSKFQDVFLKKLRKDKNVALNDALKENVFVMTVCIDNRIPLFVIGKPGSSKSLAKTIVGDNMQGNTSPSDVYKSLKRAHILSFQCSPLTDAVGIEDVFNQCIQLQSKQNLNNYTSVVVLDEIGLAEDSPKMPLKVLHPLLETGKIKDSSLSDPRTHKKVAFIGISNWALDPAKMNRGIFVTRKRPMHEDLVETAKAIFQPQLYKANHEIIRTVTKTYEEIYDGQQVEYFGLRDYYSLLKMIFATLSQKNSSILINTVFKAVQRNFSGGKTDLVPKFQVALQKILDNVEVNQLSTSLLITENITDGVDRFLLLLTIQYNAVNLLNTFLERPFEVVFGSSFPGDHNYTEVYRNINRIKGCMETGKMVVLLNLKDIYESLYDALNQHYVTFGGQRYVDIGLGGQRVKCRVHEDFRLIVIEDKDVVYNEFPIPLINRLEKHEVNSKGLLNENEMATASSLQRWAKEFVDDDEFSETDSFVGFHEDMVYSLALFNRNLKECQSGLLQSATVDAVLRKFHRTNDDGLLKEYMKKQVHDEFGNLLRDTFQSEWDTNIKMFEVKSFSQLLNNEDRLHVETCLEMNNNSVMLLTLQQFKTEVEFTNKVNQFYARCESGLEKSVLIVQCQSTESHISLYESAKYIVTNLFVMKEFSNQKIIIIFMALTNRLTTSNDKMILPLMKEWPSIYIDQVKMSPTSLTSFLMCFTSSLCDTLRQWHGSNIFVKLVHDSLADAMVMIEDKEENKARALQRIKLLDGVVDATADNEFQKAIFKKILDLTEQRESGFPDKCKSWAYDVAKCERSLHENGVYQKALWVHLKEHVAKTLSYIVSMCDSLCNLNFLEDGEAWARNLWLKIFDCNMFNTIAWEKQQEDVQAFKSAQPGGFACRFPFVTCIFKEINKNCPEFLTGFDQDINRIASACLNGMPNQKKILQCVTEEGSLEPIKSYLSDFISLKWQDSILHSIFCDIVLTQLTDNNLDDNWGVYDLVKVHLIYNSLHKNFEVLRQLFDVFPEIITEFDKKLTDEVRRNIKSLVHLALSLALGNLSQEVNSINDNDVCIMWCMKMHKTGIIIEQLLDKLPDDKKSSTQKLWKNMHFIYSFIHALIPNHERRKQFLKVVASQGKMLGIGAKRNALNNDNFVSIIVNSMKMCVTQIKPHVLTNWETTDADCCVCDEKLEEPIYFPCKHYFCKKHQTTVGEKCPYCDENQRTADLKECKWTQEQERQFKSFRSSCTSFFLDFVFENVFGNIEEDMKLHATVLKSQAYVQQALLAAIDRNIHSQLSLDFLDWNQNAIIVILQRLAKYYESDDPHYNTIQMILNATRSNAIKLALIACFESTHHSKKPKVSNKQFGHSVDQYLQDKTCTQVKTIKAIAQIRYILHVFITSFEKIDQLTPANMSNFDLDIMKVFETHKSKQEYTCIAKYLVKLGCNLKGQQWFQDVLKNNHLKVLLPHYLQTEGTNDNTDYFTVLGDQYLQLKKDLYKCVDHKAIQEQFLPGGDCKITAIKHLLLIQWTMTEQNKFQERMQLLSKLQLAYLDIPSLQKLLSQDFLNQIQTNQFLSKALQELSVVLYLVFQSNQNSVVKEFKDILDNPNSIDKKFLPGMPLSRFFQIPIEFNRDFVYQCKNGHKYTIGNCGRPWVISQCTEPGCGEQIGGVGHNLTAGNQRIKIEEKSQTGYLLSEKLSPDMELAEERLPQSPESAVIMQFMLHGAMLLASLKNERRVRTLLKSNQSPRKVLTEKMLENLQEVGKLLNKNMNDVVIFLHSFFGSLLCCNIQSVHDWSTIAKRELWEKQFGLDIIRPNVQKLENILPRLKTVIKIANAECNVQLFRLVNETDDDNSMIMWKYRIVPDDARFGPYLRNQDNMQKSVIRVIENAGNKLEKLKFLHPFVQLQQHLIERYNFQLDITASEDITFQRYLDENDSKHEDIIKKYIFMWNKLSAHVFATANPQPPKKIMTLSLKSSVMTVMPNDRGIGKFAKLFIEHFIHIHNEFLFKCKPIVKDEFGDIGQVNVDQLLPAHICIMDKETDLKPIINTHTIYRIHTSNEGVQHQLEYNLDAIEKSVKLKFVLYKKIINVQSLQQITYPQEMGKKLNFEEIKTKQRALPQLIIQEVDNSVLHASLQEICEAVNTTILVVHFINKVSHEPTKPLHTYLEEDLLLSSSRYEAIPKSSQLQDTFALHQRLCWYRSAKFAMADKNPFEDVLDEGFQVKLDKSLKKKLVDFLANTNVKDFQRNLNEVIMKAGLKGDMNLDWSLADEIIPYLDVMCNVMDEDGSWYEDLPSELLFKHALDVFKISIAYRKHE